MCKKKKRKKKQLEDQRRLFQEKLKYVYCCSLARDKMFFPFFSRVLSAAKESNLHRHYEILHEDKIGIL